MRAASRCTAAGSPAFPGCISSACNGCLKCIPRSCPASATTPPCSPTTSPRAAEGLHYCVVMPGLVPGIHVLAAIRQVRRGWPGRSPAMTKKRAIVVLSGELAAFFRECEPLHSVSAGSVVPCHPGETPEDQMTCDYNGFSIESFEAGTGLWHARIRRADQEPVVIEGLPFAALEVGFACADPADAIATAKN